MSTVYIQSERHVVKQTPTSAFFQRELKNPDIFTYFNMDTGQWILAYWLNRMARLADEIEDLGAAFEAVTPRMVEDVKRCWGPINWAKKKRLILDRERRRKQKKDEAIIQDQERWDWLKKKTQDKSPIPFGFYPKMEGGQ